MASSKTPVYDQVKAFVRQRISQGLWKPGDPVPSESALMHQFGVSRMTVNRALRELVSEGLVQRVQGSGTFVAELSRISSRLEIRDIREVFLSKKARHTFAGYAHAQIKKIETFRLVRAKLFMTCFMLKSDFVIWMKNNFNLQNTSSEILTITVI